LSTRTVDVNYNSRPLFKTVELRGDEEPGEG